MLPEAPHRAARPFLGLRPFGYEDHALFFGRESQTFALYRFLDRSRFVAVVGSSGSGKSSLVRAGLLPLLEAESADTGGRAWRWIELRPGYSPLDSLTDALAGIPGADEDSGEDFLAARRARASFALRRTSFGLAEALDEIAAPPDMALMILVDQFEELFRYDSAGVTQRGERLTRGQRQEAAAKFVQLLLEASRSAARSIHVMITMRSDFIGNCAQFYGLPEAVSASQFLVPSLTRDQREEVIRRPLEEVGAEIEPALVERLLNDGGTDLDDLPVLQHCLLRLWEQAEKTTAASGAPPASGPGTAAACERKSAGSRMRLTEEQYRAIGGLSGALSHHADEILALLPGRELAAEQAFRALSEVDREGRATRRAVAFEQLLEESGVLEGDLRLVIDRFRQDDCSFLVPSISAQPALLPETRVDVGHEALLRRWERISGKVGGALADLRNGWLWAEQDDGRFYSALVALVSSERGATAMSLPLEQVEERWSWWTSRPRTRAWAERYGGHFDQVVRLFDNSRAALQAEKLRQAALRQAERDRLEEARRRARVYRIAVFAFAALFAVAVGLSVFALHLKNQATDALDRAQQATAVAGLRLNEAHLNESRYLEGLAASKLATDPQLAELIALSALPTDMHNPDRPLWAPAISVLAEARNGDKQTAILHGHSNTVRTASFSPSGQQVITAAADETARIWDVRTGNALVVLAGHHDAVWSASFSSDGRRAVTASLDHTARVWDAGTGALVAELRGHQGPVLSAVFSPDGQRILTASADETAGLWDADNGKLLIRLEGLGGPVEAARFSPDGSSIVTVALYASTVYLWDARSGKKLSELAGHTGWVRSASFSPEGKRVVTASLDGTARIWDVAGAGSPIVLRGHEKTVESAMFSPDGKRVVTASDDGTARIWDATDGHQITILRGHTGEVLAAEFSFDGRRIVTASADRTARLWDAEDGLQLAVFRDDMHVVNNAVFSPDGRRVVTASEDRTVRIWNSSDDDLLAVVKPDAGAVQSVSFSPDGRRAVSVSQDMAARVWNLDTGTLVALLQGHQNVVTGASFSPDGSRVLTSSIDETARVYDAASGAPLQVLRGHTDEVTGARFSPDGQRIVTASRDETARVWDARSGETIQELKGHEGGLTDAVFSPDGRLVATASTDKTARLWDAASGAVLHILQGHDAAILAVAFSPDGTSVVTASEDATARVWDARSGAMRLVLRGHEGRVLAASFSPDGTRVATASEDHTARLWDARTGRMLCILPGHTGPVRDLAFSRAGDRVLTASDDRTARIWDAQTCATLAVLQGHRGRVSAAQFSPDGARIVTGSEDKTIRLWKTWPLLSADMVSYTAASMIRSFTAAERAFLFSAQDSSTGIAPAGLGAAGLCDRLAADPLDPDKRAPGVTLDNIDVERALPACRSALQETPNAPTLQYQLARVLIRNGDTSGAIELYRSAADKHYAAAQYALAYADAHDPQGRGDAAAAKQLFQNAAKDGYLKGYYELGDLAWRGGGAPPDRKEALAWFTRGADRGDPFSHRRLADLYERGDEVEQAFDKALLHYAIAIRRMKELADESDSEAAQEHCGALARALDPVSVAAIVRAAQAWKPAPAK